MPRKQNPRGMAEIERKEGTGGHQRLIKTLYEVRLPTIGTNEDKHNGTKYNWTVSLYLYSFYDG